VTEAMAEEYIGHIGTRGPWVAETVRQYARRLDLSTDAIRRYMSMKGFPAKGPEADRRAFLEGQKARQVGKRGKGKVASYSDRALQLSTAARNNYLTTCRMVFKVLADDAGLVTNPFAQIEKLENVPEDREAFTPEELRTIADTATGWIYSLFMVGVNTGLREGDICTLRWREVDLERRRITRRMNKTKKEVTIPVLPSLFDYFKLLARDSEYCFPELADRYLNHRGTIGWHVTQFLDKHGIETKRQVAGRTRAASVKDVHSCRHTFCYLAALNHVPLPVVQSVVGHMSQQMTKRYTDHATQEAMRDALAAIPDYMSKELPGVAPDPAEQADRDRLRDLAGSLPIEQVRTLLAQAR